VQARRVGGPRHLAYAPTLAAIICRPRANPRTGRGPSVDDHTHGWKPDVDDHTHGWKPDVDHWRLLGTDVLRERPHALKDKDPELYGMLRDYFGQDPAAKPRRRGDRKFR
jgi:hypothetical protein